MKCQRVGIEHSDLSISDDDTATAACFHVATERSPARRQVSEEGSQAKIEE